MKKLCIYIIVILVVVTTSAMAQAEVHKKILGSQHFQPTHNQEDYSNYRFLYIGVSNIDGFFTSPLDLPDGAVIFKTKIAYMSFGPFWQNNEASIQLIRFKPEMSNLYTVADMELGSTASGSLSDLTFETFQLPRITINNEKWMYQLLLHMKNADDSVFYFYSIQVYYRIQAQ